MVEPREPARSWYDAEIGLHPEHPAEADQTVYGLVRFTFEIMGQRLRLTESTPLEHPLPGEDPPLPPGTDFWPRKNMTDVAVQGSAFAAGGRPTPEMDVRLDVGDRARTVRVFGDREIRWEGSGRPRIGPPEPFEEIPLNWERAYGGIDLRVPIPEIRGMDDVMALRFDHPGLYPRNPFGTGYLVPPDPIEDQVMPNLEDPHDLLDEDRLLVHDPRRWHLQPIPACLDFMSAGAFPRKVFLHSRSEPWFEPPEGEGLPEVRRGFLSAGYRSYMRGRPHDGPDPLFFQEASPGLIFPGLEPGTPVRIVGMHPEFSEIEFRTPSAHPSLTLFVDGRALPGEVRLHHLVCRPDALRVVMVYGVTATCPRFFVPGIHKRIPIFLKVGDDEPVTFAAPPTYGERRGADAEEAPSPTEEAEAPGAEEASSSSSSSPSP